MRKWISRGVATAITAVLGVWINYLVMPAWNIRSAGMWGFVLLISIIASMIFVIFESISKDKNRKKYFEKYCVTLACVTVSVIVLVGMLICGITSSHMFNADNYHNIIDIEEGNFNEDIPKVSENIQISIVDVATATKVGDRTVGSIKNATWYEVDDEYNLIKYQGKYYRISELNYGGLFKYNKAKYDGIPGYVLVDAETQEAKYVELENPIRYSPSAHFSYLLKRHLRNQYPSYMFDKSFFEIDDEGKAYYITGVERPSIGVYGGKKVESFIITDASTGESKEYKTEDLPKWVDHAYSLDYLMRVTDNNQAYINGYWNSLFSQTGVNVTTYEYKGDEFDGYNTAINANGDIVFYTGVTPASGAESNLGFILANPRTGKITYYTCPGAEESSAQNAAQGLVQNLGYTATFPTILNVDGEETYLMFLKDKAGLVQRYALANIKDYTKVVQAETFEEALESYKEKIGTTVLGGSTEKDEIQLLEGIIQEIYQAQIEGCTYYYYIIEGSTELYMSSIKNSNKQVILKPTDKITIEYKQSSEKGVCLVTKITF